MDPLFESPCAELVRMERAIGNDLATTLSVLPGVQKAHVHVHIPSANPLATLAHGARPQSASVVLESNAPSHVDIHAVKEVVAHALGGVHHENISVTLVTPSTAAAQTTLVKVGPLWVAEASKGPTLALVGGCLGLVLVLSLALFGTARMAQRGSTTNG